MNAAIKKRIWPLRQYNYERLLAIAVFNGSVIRHFQLHISTDFEGVYPSDSAVGPCP